MRAPRAALTALVASAAVLAGCGSSDSDQVRSKVQQFEQAVSSHDAKTLCQQVLAPSLAGRFEVEGLTCEQGLTKFYFGSVEKPTLSVGRITIGHGTAAALVLTGAHCQRLALAQLNLIKTSGGWRINSESSEQPGRRTC
jgi:hypothetical protein